MSKKLITLIFTILLSFSVQAKSNFVPGISDLPVPANFHLLQDSSGVFNNGFGRLVTANFKGKANEEDIIDFYNKTLPALGWRKKERLKYTRSGETLIIKITEINQTELLINFQLMPS